MSAIALIGSVTLFLSEATLKRDFGIVIHGGWNKGKALLYNFLSALTFLLGGIVAYGASFVLDVTFLLPFAAGNFIYIAAADLIPEIKHHDEPRARSSISSRSCPGLGCSGSSIFLRALKRGGMPLQTSFKIYSAISRNVWASILVILTIEKRARRKWHDCENMNALSG
jgi:hypothetical protein